MSGFRLIVGDALAELRKLPAESVQTVITSPPYWGLRDYGVEGQIGLEPNPDAYVARMVEVFRHVRRVLRGDGTLWLNLGDSYAAGGNGGGGSFAADGLHCGEGKTMPPKRAPLGLKPKDLVGIPWRVAFALQADGWWLRSDIIWSKPNPMPSSVRDRPTTAHEYLFLLSKSERYYFDASAIAEDAVSNRHKARDMRGGTSAFRGQAALRPRGKNERIETHVAASSRRLRDGFNDRWDAAEAAGEVAVTRNRRSVWTIGTQAYRGAHFAVMPEALVEPCVLAGTSEKGCCAACGAPIARQVARSFQPQGDVSPEKGVRGAGDQKPLDESNNWQGFPRGTTATTTTGWAPTCACRGGQTPCVVLDPFCGSGTVGVVALKHGREFIGIELSPAYAALARERIRGDAPLLNRAAGAAP